ncbi:MAG: hypothetical protein GWP07_01085 [Xanthomonadaceae bacterium]|nr:hypothetical protein [Xanthomonadaceae bacterium]
MKFQKKSIRFLAISVYFIFLLVSFLLGFSPGEQIGGSFFSFSIEMLKILPCAFVLIGLFEVWVKKEKVEKHLGRESGFIAYIWVILLAGTTVGGLYVAFPVAYSLYNKGAKLSVIFTYVGAAAICRIPMTIFEASFMGIRFSLIRLTISIPLVVLSSIWLGNYLEKRNYKIMAGK